MTRSLPALSFLLLFLLAGGCNFMDSNREGGPPDEDKEAVVSLHPEAHV